MWVAYDWGMTNLLSTSLSVFRGRLMRAAGLSIAAVPLLVACTSEVVVQNSASSGAGGATSSSNSTGSTSVTGSNTSVATVGVTIGVGGSGPATSTGVGGGVPANLACFAVSGQQPCPSLQDAPSKFFSCTDDGYWIEQWVSGPYLEDDACCYEVVATEPCGVGRPFVDAEGALVASPCAGDDAWLPSATGEEREPLSEPSPELRAELAAGWLQDGLHEHASIASFARFTLELMTVAAPPHLIEASNRAALDEAEHARLCFALAARHRGEAVGPGRFPLPAQLEIRRDLTTLAAATALEGCIGETLAAVVASEQARHAVDPHARAALQRIAADEAQHAELAWQTVAWALRQGGDEVRIAVTKVFADARNHMLPIAVCEQKGGLVHGRLDAATADAVQRKALEEVVMPCALALLGNLSRTAATEDAAESAHA